MMRAKLQVSEVKENRYEEGGEVQNETVKMFPVTTTDFDKDGHSEDNTYARYTPSGDLQLTISNPALFGKFKVGQKFYADFTEADVAPASKTEPDPQA